MTLFDHEGKPLRMLGRSEDVTEGIRLAKEAELSRSKTLFLNALRS